ncbi:hypothetical protein ACLB1E_26175 [Escherichia coli]
MFGIQRLMNGADISLRQCRFLAGGDGHCVNVLSCLSIAQVTVAPGFTQR